MTAARALADPPFMGNLFQVAVASELNAASLGLPPTQGTDRKPVPDDVRGRDGSEVTRRSEVYFWTQSISSFRSILKSMLCEVMRAESLSGSSRLIHSAKPCIHVPLRPFGDPSMFCIVGILIDGAAGAV